MRRKRNRKKIDELNCTISSEIKENEKNIVDCVQNDEQQFSKEKHSPMQLKGTPDEFLYRKKIVACTELNEVSNLSSTSLIQPSDTNDSQMSQNLETASTCDLLLDCQEESLCPVQQNFYSEDWLKYVKYTATLSQIPSLSVVNGSDVGEKIPSGVSTPKELPVLFFSNAVQQPKIIKPPVHSSVKLSTPLMVTSGITSVSAFSDSNKSMSLPVPRPYFASSLPNHLIKNVYGPYYAPPLPTVNNYVTKNNIPVAPVASNVFPVKLEKVAHGSTEKLPDSESSEEILPLISIDSKIENFIYNVESSNDTPSSASLAACDSNKSSENYVENISSLSSDSGGDQFGLPPELLCKMEVNFEESESNSLPDSFTRATVPLPAGSEDSSDECNGPKIVDIVSGNAGGASVFFKGEKNIMQMKMVDFDSTAKKGKDCSDTNGSLPTGDFLPKVVTQWSIFSMQKTIAVISSGNVEPRKHNLLALRPHIPPPSPEKYAGTKLKIRLREENFLTLSVWWLLEKRYLPLNAPCVLCFGKVFRISSSQDYPDGLCWVCDDPDCGKTYPVKRPRFFEQFPHYSLEELLLLTYHWAVKSPVWVVLKDVPSTEEKVWDYFTALQQLCGRYVKDNCTIGKVARQITTVEVSAVKLGKFFILCAFDRSENVSRLQALTTEEACNSMKHIEILDSWLTKFCRLITWKKISDDCLPHILKLPADPSITDYRNPGRHILNASKFLGRTMVQLFQNICHEHLSIEVVQNILDEVQWRERRGKIEESAFWNILNEISSMNESYYYTEAKLGTITSDRYFYKADASFQMRWGPYDIGEKTSSSYNVSEVNEDMIQAISTCVRSCTNKVKDSTIFPCTSTSKRCASDITTSKAKHPICVDPQNTAPGVQRDVLPAPFAVDTGSIRPQDLLSIKIIFNSSEKAQNEAKIKAVNLGESLKKEGYLSNPVRWLATQKLIEVQMPCYVCQSKAILADNHKFPDKICWMCQKPACRFLNKYKRPPFFAAFGFKLEIIFAIIYHWAVQSDYRTLMKSVPVYETNILCVHRKLQSICAEVAKRDLFKLGGKKFIVEVALVKFSNCFILGAMERETKFSRLQAYSIQTKLHIDNIRRTLMSWLNPETIVVVNSNKYLGTYAMDDSIHLVFADKTIQNVHSRKFHTLTISNYLQNHMRNMFGSFNVQNMTANILQVYLDELVWRERYGGTPTLAFKNIIRHIFAAPEAENPSSFIGIREDVMIENAAAYYNIDLIRYKPVVCVERLPDYVIQRYTSPETDPIKIDEPFVLDRKIKEEIISDDEVQIVDDNTNSKISADSSKHDGVQIVDDNTNSKIAAGSSSAKHDGVQIVDDNTNSKIAASSSAKHDELLPVEDEGMTKLERYYNTPKNIPLVVKKSINLSSRYSDKCYSYKRKADEGVPFSKFRCIECKSIVSEDHFMKMYSCTDCKYYKYSTYCQKAFAQHRYYVLFGRKMVSSESETSHYHHHVPLTEYWYCSCGFSSREGNELASHLVSCDHKTCYMDIDVSEPGVL